MPTRTAIRARRPDQRHQERYPDIEISVSPIPKNIRRARPSITDIDTLKAKVDARRARAITQVFFDNDLYSATSTRPCRGIEFRSCPAIMPMHNLSRARSFVTRAARRCRLGVADKFEGLDDDARRASWWRQLSPPPGAKTGKTRRRYLHSTP